jgi:P27 family predicted phage terminase small subunit
VAHRHGTEWQGKDWNGRIGFKTRNGVKRMSLVGRKPIPTHLKILRGNPGKRALPQNEPEPTLIEDVPEAPPFVQGYARIEWERVAAELVRLNLLSILDVGVLSAYCVAYARWRTAEEMLLELARRDPALRGLLLKSSRDGMPVNNPLVRIAAHAASDMTRYGTELGLSPSARARIATGPIASAKANKFTGLLGGG